MFAQSLRNLSLIAASLVALVLHGCATIDKPEKTAQEKDIQEKDIQLNNTQWLAEDINGAGVMDILQTTLQFDEALRISGFGGCNRYSGSASIAGQSIKVGPLASTRMACPASIMNQESAFLAALESASNLEIDNQRRLLYIYNNQQQRILRFSLMTDTK